jgi:hypothetical protein
VVEVVVFMDTPTLPIYIQLVVLVEAVLVEMDLLYIPQLMECHPLVVEEGDPEIMTPLVDLAVLVS